MPCEKLISSPTVSVQWKLHLQVPYMGIYEVCWEQKHVHTRENMLLSTFSFEQQAIMIMLNLPTL